MKKIILLAASVLALGLLASCKQEITGDLKVESNMNQNGDYWTKNYYYTAAGSYSQKRTETNTSKASASATETNTGLYQYTKDDTWSLSTGDKGVTLTVEEKRNSNVVTYTYALPKMIWTTVTTRTTGGATGSVITSDEAGQYASTNLSIVITKIDGKYYFTGVDGSRIQIKDFNPTADTIDFSKLVDTTSTTTVTYTTPHYDNAAGTATAAVTYFGNKKVETKSGITYALTLTKTK
jgi:uncharacterized protein (DUF2141 family)